MAGAGFLGNLPSQTRALGDFFHQDLRGFVADFPQPRRGMDDSMAQINRRRMGR